MADKHETSHSHPTTSSPATGDILPPQSSSLTLPSPPSEMEAKFYYAGLPSAPILVARTSTSPWDVKNVKELGPANHAALGEAWDGDLGFKVCALLDSMNVMFTSLDVVGMGNVGEHPAPVVLWIGVMPATLSGVDGVVVASKCREILVEANITDVDVEIRESIVTRY